jgi:hypothetical protein
MKVQLLPLVLVCVACGAARGAIEDDFAACLKNRGPEYRAARDRLLAAPAAGELLRQRLRSEQWDERLAAFILSGWLANQDRYRQLLAAVRVTDQKGVERYSWAVQGEPLRREDAPLLYELLTKDPAAGDEWDPALALVRMAERRPEITLDVLSLHQFFQRATFSSRTQHLATAWLLGNLPLALQRDKENYLLESLQAELARKEPSEEAAGPLLQGLGRAAQTLTAGDRDKLVEQVVQLPKLVDLLGETLLTHSLGGIGGDKASQRVARHLENTDDPIEKQWALATLSRSNSAVGTRTLLAYASDGRAALRDEAIKGLARVPYTEAVGQKLVELAAAEQVPVGTKRLIARSTIAIAERNKNNPQIREQARTLMTTVSGKLQNNDLKQELDDAIKQFSNR